MSSESFKVDSFFETLGGVGASTSAFASTLRRISVVDALALTVAGAVVVDAGVGAVIDIDAAVGAVIDVDAAVAAVIDVAAVVEDEADVIVVLFVVDIVAFFEFFPDEESLLVGILYSGLWSFIVMSPNLEKAAPAARNNSPTCEAEVIFFSTTIIFLGGFGGEKMTEIIVNIHIYGHHKNEWVLTGL